MAGVISQPTTQIVAVPIAQSTAPVLPGITVYPGKLEISQNLRESSSNQPRAQKLRQEIAIDSSNPAVSYQLEKPPIRESISCKFIIAEEEKLLKSGKDFTIDYEQSTITFAARDELAKASKILLEYSSLVGVLTVREFQQEFFIHIYDSNPANLEKLISLVTGSILINQEPLIQNYNFTEPTQYQTQNDGIITTHFLNKINFIEGNYNTLIDKFEFQIKFKTFGQLKVTKTVTEALDIIEKVNIVSDVFKP
ncbi:MAG: hypothetical protein AB1589_02635 [Cyanobacteriota bacterium]